jgi:hypothetical protein
MITPEMNVRMDKCINQYLKVIKKWLGNAKEILLVYTKPKNNSVPFSVYMRSVLEADGKKVGYINQSDFEKFRQVYGTTALNQGLKTVIVENNEKNISQVPLKLAKDIIRDSKSENSDNLRYITTEGFFTPEQIHSIYLYNVLRRKQLY